MGKEILEFLNWQKLTRRGKEKPEIHVIGADTPSIAVKLGRGRRHPPSFCPVRGAYAFCSPEDLQHLALTITKIAAAVVHIANVIHGSIAAAARCLPSAKV